MNLFPSSNIVPFPFLFCITLPNCFIYETFIFLFVPWCLSSSFGTLVVHFLPLLFLCQNVLLLSLMFYFKPLHILTQINKCPSSLAHNPLFSWCSCFPHWPVYWTHLDISIHSLASFHLKWHSGLPLLPWQIVLCHTNFSALLCEGEQSPGLIILPDHHQHVCVFSGQGWTFIIWSSTWRRNICVLYWINWVLCIWSEIAENSKIIYIFNKYTQWEILLRY